MKVYEFSLEAWQVADFFSPIRTKKDIIEILMNSIKLMLISPPLKDEASQQCKLVLKVSKMSRLFFFSENKYFSIHFPYTVAENKGTPKFSSKFISDIDNKVTSQVISVIKDNESFESLTFYDLLETYEDIGYEDDSLHPFLLELYSFEDGYIRYDQDEVNSNGELHPIHHYDVFYSTNSTFKVGLRKSIGAELMIDLLELNTNCHFFEQGSP